jgi:hypothetical protein
MSSTDGFIAALAFGALCSVAGLLTAANMDMEAAYIEWASTVCDKNDGLKSLDRTTATCKNGAEFTLGNR